MAKGSKPDTPEKVILGVLVYEFRSDDHEKSEAIIKKRLRYYKLGPYEQERVDLLRKLKDSLQKEIGRLHRSTYYLGSHGRYAGMKDFDVPRILDVYFAEFPEIDRSQIEWFVPFAVFTYYLR
ncbi:hypothetical protein LOC71_06500 [Rhodopirellula sp. JC740]|uniref:Uncharacterized protein n=1 Tax=Rhodopirellula halodulae TaxID=2894198 RepID=A0ABS8NEF0_9BACT|nr:hypothetical protein [Rhodopirellula sp. JC740]MCC9641918.1 hypothetical protein [Rhodopirellula sp. JC740]